MYGLDTISTGVAVSFAMECFEKGILTSRDTDGIEPTFGNAHAMLELIEKIAFRKGFGNLLADGTRSAAEKIGRGAPDLAMQVKGTEIPMHEPRHKQTLAVHYSIHAGGADHGTGPHETPLDETTAQVMYKKGFSAQLTNTVGLCKFVPWSEAHVEAALEAVTGWKQPAAELERVVDRGITLTRIFNLREGFTEKDDRLPRRFTETPKEGPLTGIDPIKLESAQREYYRLLGWNEKGVPTEARLAELEIAWAARFIPSSL
jgi:aldehyde:ferredoxin oxidoreductase